MKTFTVAAALSAFALTANAACGPTQTVNGTMQALCTDEVTGFDFIYEDLDGHVGNELAEGDDSSTAMYNAYLSGISNNTSIVQQDDAAGTWKVCKDKVAGVCSNKHVIAWSGTGVGLITAITAVITSVNHVNTLDTKPRSKCTNYKNNGTVCVSWAAYYHAQMTSAQVQDISRECEIECGKSKLSCEARLVTDNSVEYFCVSNRASGCTDNNSINHC